MTIATMRSSVWVPLLLLGVLLVAFVGSNLATGRRDHDLAWAAAVVRGGGQAAAAVLPDTATHARKLAVGQVTALELYRYDFWWFFGLIPRKVTDLTDGYVVNLQELGQSSPSFTVKAVVSGGDVSAVEFAVNDEVEAASAGSYYLCGEFFLGLFPIACAAGENLGLGQHTVTVTPSNGSEEGAPFSVTFSIVQSVNPDMSCNVPVVRTKFWVFVQLRTPHSLDLIHTPFAIPGPAVCWWLGTSKAES